MRFSLDRPNTLRYRDEEIVAELLRVASVFKNRRFSRHEFDQVASYCKGTVVLSRFGSWQAALNAAGLVLDSPPKKDRSRIKNADLFHEMERVWRIVGHRPSKDEWETQTPAYSYTTYKVRFEGWLNACAAFIEHISERSTDVASDQYASSDPGQQSPDTKALSSEDRRGVPMKLRYRVLVKANFRCVLCGRSPALEPGVCCLHVDHITPFASGGKTVEENLRALCESCNWGKGGTQIEG